MCFLKESKSFIIIIMTLKEKCSVSSLSDPQSHIESVLIRYKSKFKLLQPFLKCACKTVNCLLHTCDKFQMLMQYFNFLIIPKIFATEDKIELICSCHFVS